MSLTSMKILLLCTLTFATAGRRVKMKSASSELITDIVPPTETAVQGGEFNPYTSFESFFKAEGFNEEQCAKIWEHFRKDQIKGDQWPLRDHTKELEASVTNFANNNKEEIKTAIRNAGGNPDDSSSITAEVTSEAESKLTKRPVVKGQSSLVETGAANNPFGATPWAGGQVSGTLSSTETLAATMNMLSSSVATNTAAVAGLTAAVGSNTAALAQIGASVATMSQVAAPTMALASTLGVSAGTVATLALAGSFVGPLVGVIALIYVTWPEEEIDPWLQIEERVNMMITDKFDAVRRKRLGDRMRRYVRQFAQCSKAWVATVMVKKHGVALPKWIVEDAKAALASGTDFSLVGVRKEWKNQQPPACMQELEGHMSLERDEWFTTEQGRMGGLFMPFANMHTQMLSMLADHPYADKMEWRSTLRGTAAEYGAYMLKHTIAAWKAQVCRTMRLRQSIKVTSLGWKYQWIVLKPIFQPHAAEACSAKCGGKQGWCSWCGGKNVGACCQHGDTSNPVCKKFDTPLQAGLISNGMAPVCVHTDCIQSNTAYTGEDPVKKIESFEKRPEECQAICQDLAGAVAFTVNPTEKSCTCLSQNALSRRTETGSSSGPTVCGKPDDSVEAREERFQEQLSEAPINAPMEEVEPCEKSDAVSNYPGAETGHEGWVKDCMSKAAAVVTQDFNTFFKRIGKSLDSMAWSAGCGAQRIAEWDQVGWTSIAQDSFDTGSFADCNWKREEEMDSKMTWHASEERARGWTGSSKVAIDEQMRAKIGYPMPTWLKDLSRQLQCMEDTAAGKVKNNADGRSTAVNTMMESAAMSIDVLAASSS